MGAMIYHTCRLPRASSFAESLMIARESLSTIDRRRRIYLDDYYRLTNTRVQGSVLAVDEKEQELCANESYQESADRNQYNPANKRKYIEKPDI